LANSLVSLVKENFYDPRTGGSFSIKKVLPVLTDHLRYEELDEVQGATGAQVDTLRPCCKGHAACALAHP
jgi:hypothetical protein